MKKANISINNLFSICLILLFFVSPGIKSENRLKETNNAHDATRILIVGLSNNVRSNYFYNKLITEETGIKEEMIDNEYNSIIAENIASAPLKQNVAFVLARENELDNGLMGQIRITGEEGECNADLSEIPAEKLKQTLEKADADYLLTINQHYLKWQERPLRTLFHIVSYTLFDKEKKEICHGNNFFTSMNLETPDKVRKTSKKSSSKIASSIIKSLNEN